MSSLSESGTRRKYPGTGYWIKPAGSTTTPTAIVSVLCETQSIGPDPAMRGIGHILSAVHVCAQVRRGAHWSDASIDRFTSGDALHDWLEAWASNRGRTWVFAPMVAETFVLTDWWDRIVRRGCRLRTRADKADEVYHASRGRVRPNAAQERARERQGPSDPAEYVVSTMTFGKRTEIVRYRTLGKSFSWHSHAQYCPANEEQLARSIGHVWSNAVPNDTRHPQTHRPVGERALLWCRFYREYIDWWQSIAGGPWGASTAGNAWSFLRSRLQARTVLVHRSPQTYVLEEAAIVGGRREIFYAGNVGSIDQWQPYQSAAPARSTTGELLCPMVELDVKSMYPWLLREMPFPVKRINYKRRCSVAALTDYLESFGVIAKVTIQTYEPCFPLRIGERLIYPIGLFTTTLAGPELLLAVHGNHVQHVHAAAIYKLGKPFADAASAMLSYRGLYAETGQDGWEMLSKLLGNSMSGKLAQKYIALVPRPEIRPPIQWGPWMQKNLKTGEKRHYTIRAGMAWEHIQQTSASRSLGAAYAYLTSYCRVMMWIWSRTLDERSILAMDTDGMWVKSSTLHVLNSLPHDAVDPYGELTPRHTSPVGRFFGPQQYWHGDGWVLSGRRCPVIVPGEGRISTVARQALLSTSPHAPNGIVYDFITKSAIADIYTSGEVQPDGWILPPKVYIDHG